MTNIDPENMTRDEYAGRQAELSKAWRALASDTAAAHETYGWKSWQYHRAVSKQTQACLDMYSFMTEWFSARYFELRKAEVDREYAAAVSRAEGTKLQAKNVLTGALVCILIGILIGRALA